MALLTFLSVALLTYGAMHFYALRKIWVSFPQSWALALALTIAGIVLTFSPLLVWYLERQSWHRATVAAAWISYTWMGYLFLFICIALLFDLGRLLATMFNFKWPITAALAFRMVSLLAFAALGYGLFEARQIQVREVNISTPKLASGRLTIAQISDLHLGIMIGGAFVDRVISRVRELEPDILVATGDIVDGQGDNLVELARHFQSYTPPLGAYAVTGNHETYAGLESSLLFLRNAGFTVLRGESAKAGGIVIKGVDDPTAATSGPRAGRDSGDHASPVNADDFIVLLKHRPVADSSLPFDLQLSGHVHGGQIFPFVFLTWLAYRVGTGLTELTDGRRLYVSRGAGTWGPPLRLLAPPEITLITISATR